MERGAEASGVPRSRSRVKPFLATTVTLLLVAVAVCAVVAVFSSNSGAPSGTAAALPEESLGAEARSLLVDSEPQPEDEGFVVDDSADSEEPRIRAARFAKLDDNGTEDSSNEADPNSHINTMFNTNPSCFSDLSNKTVPAAHITGRGRRFLPSTEKSRTSNPHAPTGYQQMWKCTEIQSQSHRPTVHAFVDGGMCFNQTDKTLGVPKCGYYMVTSQILFSMNQHSLSESRSVYHLMKFNRNCPGSHSIDPTLTVTGKSTVGPYSENSHAGVVTTFTSDVIKFCTGGKIWIEIPDFENGIPCCPTGDTQGTFITAILVRESTCHWPPDTKIRYLDNN